MTVSSHFGVLIAVAVATAGCSQEGPAGPKGDTGATGAPGATGPQGPRGDTVLVAVPDGGQAIVDGGVLLVAGPPGPQGPIGGGRYVSRTDVYCRDSAPLGGMSADVQCSGTNDLVLSGGCDFNPTGHTLRTDVVAVINAPWPHPAGGLTGWRCQWAYQTGSTASAADFPDAGYVARVCCITVP